MAQIHLFVPPALLILGPQVMHPDLDETTSGRVSHSRNRRHHPFSVFEDPFGLLLIGDDLLGRRTHDTTKSQPFKG